MSMSPVACAKPSPTPPPLPPPPALVERVVLRVPLDENELRAGAEGREPAHGLLDVALLVAARADDRHARERRRGARDRPGDHPVGPHEPTEDGQVREEAVGEAADGPETERQEDVAARAHGLEAGEPQEVLDAADGRPVEERQRVLEPEELEEMHHRLPDAAVPVD